MMRIKVIHETSTCVAKNFILINTRFQTIQEDKMNDKKDLFTNKKHMSERHLDI